MMGFFNVRRDPPPTPLSGMGKILTFTRPSDDYEDVVALLRTLADEERAERKCEWLEEAVRRAKEIPRPMAISRPLRR